jgi:hypothetical protein
MPEEEAAKKPRTDPGPIKTEPVKRSEPPPKTKVEVDPGQLRTVRLRKLEKPSRKR